MYVCLYVCMYVCLGCGQVRDRLHPQLSESARCLLVTFRPMEDLCCAVLCPDLI